MAGRWTKGQMGRRVGEGTDEQMDRQTDKWTAGKMGWVYGQINRSQVGDEDHRSGCEESNAFL